jgi:hypothetical protein
MAGQRSAQGRRRGSRTRSLTCSAQYPAAAPWCMETYTGSAQCTRTHARQRSTAEDEIDVSVHESSSTRLTSQMSPGSSAEGVSATVASTCRSLAAGARLDDSSSGATLLGCTCIIDRFCRNSRAGHQAWHFLLEHRHFIRVK